MVMKNNKNLGLCVLLMLTFAAVFSSCDDSMKDSNSNVEYSSLYVVARQGADAPIQYKAEMPLFSIENIKSFNTETGELTLQNFVFDTHLFHDIGCRYRVYFYDGNDLLFDARPVSWLSSAAYFNDLTFQCDVYGPDDMWDASKSHFYIRYGYPGTVQGDETVEELMKKNEKGMNHFINILSQRGKIVNGL